MPSIPFKVSTSAKHAMLASGRGCVIPAHPSNPVTLLPTRQTPPLRTTLRSPFHPPTPATPPHPPSPPHPSTHLVLAAAARAASHTSNSQAAWSVTQAEPRHVSPGGGAIGRWLAACSNLRPGSRIGLAAGHVDGVPPRTAHRACGRRERCEGWAGTSVRHAACNAAVWSQT